MYLVLRLAERFAQEPIAYLEAFAALDPMQQEILLAYEEGRHTEEIQWASV